MKLSTSLLITCCSLGMLSILHAADGGWSVSVGTQVRRVGVNFGLKAPPLPNVGRGYTLREASGLGDVGVARSGTDFIVYEDGSVGTDQTPGKFGDSSFQVDSVSQVTFGTMAPGDDFPFPGTVVFHSSGTTYAYDQQASSSAWSGDDDVWAVGPSVEFRRQVFERGSFGIGVMLGWSYFQSDHDTGSQMVGAVAVRETTTQSRYTYTYDLASSGAPQGFPPVYDNSFRPGVIVDANEYNGFGGFLPGSPYAVLDPRTSTSSTSTSRVVSLLQVIASARLRLHTNVVPMLAEANWQVTPHALIGLAVGPTLNVVSHDLQARTLLVLNGRPVAAQDASSSGTHVSVGATARATFTAQLGARGHWAASVSAGYDWVPSYQVSAGPARADIDLSSFVAQAALVYRF